MRFSEYKREFGLTNLAMQEAQIRTIILLRVWDKFNWERGSTPFMFAAWITGAIKLVDKSMINSDSLLKIHGADGYCECKVIKNR